MQSTWTAWIKNVGKKQEATKVLAGKSNPNFQRNKTKKRNMLGSLFSLTSN